MRRWNAETARGLRKIQRQERFWNSKRFLDRSPDDVVKFRATKFNMPWLNAFAEKELNSDLTKRFEIVSIPKPILVDDKGNIIAVEMDLRGTNLENTLAKHLDTPKN